MLIQTFDNFRVLGYVSNSANFEITEINNYSKCIDEVSDDLKVRTLRGRGTLKTYKKGTRGKGSRN